MNEVFRSRLSKVRPCTGQTDKHTQRQTKPNVLPQLQSRVVKTIINGRYLRTNYVVSKYNSIIVCPEARWPGLICRTHQLYSRQWLWASWKASVFANDLGGRKCILAVPSYTQTSSVTVFTQHPYKKDCFIKLWSLGYKFSVVHICSLAILWVRSFRQVRRRRHRLQGP